MQFHNDDTIGIVSMILLRIVNGSSGNGCDDDGCCGVDNDDGCDGRGDDTSGLLN